MKQFGLAKILLIFYLLIASGLTENLMAKQLKEFIISNKIAQHIIGFVTMFSLIIIFGEIDTKSGLIYAILGYILFIITTKLDLHWNIIILIILIFGYMYENDIDIRENEMMDDKNLTKEKKEEIIERNNRTKLILIGGITIISIIGTIFYSYKKHIQYQNSYDPISYIFF
jgi:hypothetical protein